jgi:ABC-type phosphate transport system auxiliary subunit
MVKTLSKPMLQGEIEALRMRKKRLQQKLKAKYDELVFSPSPDKCTDQLTEYQTMNNELRKVKIFEAELVYLRNML